MKIALVCTQGGHLTEMLLILKAFENHDIFFITYKNSLNNQIKYPKYQTENIGTNTLKMARAFVHIYKILKKEKPDMVVSTGAEIAIPSIILAKLMRIKTVYIESWCRIKTRSGAGKILYYFSDLFLVQWPELIKIYGKRAKYKGAVI